MITQLFFMGAEVELDDTLKFKMNGMEFEFALDPTFQKEGMYCKAAFVSKYRSYSVVIPVWIYQNSCAGASVMLCKAGKEFSGPYLSMCSTGNKNIVDEFDDFFLVKLDHMIDTGSLITPPIRLYDVAIRGTM